MHNVKVLYVTGDSFPWGSELGLNWEQDDANYNFTEYKKNHVYPSLIANHFKITDCINGALPGASNERSYRVLINDVTKLLQTYDPFEIFVTVSLTSPFRREFHNSNGTEYMHINSHEPPKNSPQYNLWKILMTDFNHDPASYMADFMIILAIQNFLITSNVPYLITTSMRYEFEYLEFPKHIPDYLYKKLIDDVRHYGWPSFSSYTEFHKTPRGKNYHPLEEGHRIWADHLISVIQDRNLLYRENTNENSSSSSR